jgi:3-deoxy-manno-octulosonate cytidylyltransferase (CMP-KDO synthetase)
MAAAPSGRTRTPVAEAVIVIPARYHSTRFPGKPLAKLWGRPLIQHVYQRAVQCKRCSRVIVATDDAGIAAAASSVGAEVAMTRPDHPSGTDRVAEVARGIDCDLVVNVQGDEPLVDPASIDAAVEPLAADASVPMGTLCAPIEETTDLANPNVVKVVLDQAGFALYFSRLPIPFVTDGRADAIRYRHIGVYVYRREFLLKLGQLSPTPLEAAEKLEQLRVLEHGHRLRVVIVPKASPGIDTPADLAALEGRGPDSS